MSTKRPGECYFCGSRATSSEHVPPKCLFPEQKDFPEKDLRKNLITVPSCDVHNSHKSRDDEFLMACLAPIVGNNSTAYRHAATKVARAQTRNVHLIGETIRESREFDLRTPGGISVPVLVGKPDMPRLCRTLQAIARGLYRHARGLRFSGKVIAIPSFVNFTPGCTIGVIQVLSRRMVGAEKKDWATHGDNPEVFTYQMGPVDEFGLTPMVMNFYSGAEVYIGFQPDGVTLPHKSIFDATAAEPIEVDITLGEGGSTRKISWRCPGD